MDPFLPPGHLLPVLILSGSGEEVVACLIVFGERWCWVLAEDVGSASCPVLLDAVEMGGSAGSGRRQCG